MILSPRLFRRVATALLCLPLFVACHKIQARFEMKKAIAAYKEGSYRVALEQYQKGLAIDPSLREHWRSLGYSAMALYHPGETTPENQELANTAAEAFEKYLEVKPDDAKVAEYLTGLLIDAGRIDEALARLRKDAASSDPEQAQQANRSIVGLFVREKRMDDAWAWITRPDAPRDYVPLLTIGVKSWDAAYRDPTLDPVARGAVVDRGLEALRRVIDYAPTVPEGATYYNLLLREKAKLESDELAAQELYKQAEEWRAKASELYKAQRAAQAAAAAAAS